MGVCVVPYIVEFYLSRACSARAQCPSTSKAPQVDGDVLNDEAWLGAEAATGFVQVRPFEGRSASQRTEVFVGYTEDTLYIGVMCYDKDPSGLIISDGRRDSRLSSVDSFKVIIDSFLDRQNGFIFGTTPGAVEYDGQVVKEGSSRFGSGGGGFNKNWDAAWVVQAQVNKQGWVRSSPFLLSHCDTAQRTCKTGGLTSNAILRVPTRPSTGHLLMTT